MAEEAALAARFPVRVRRVDGTRRRWVAEWRRLCEGEEADAAAVKALAVQAAWKPERERSIAWAGR